ncbi:hypothetical protein, partial [Litorimonas sp.]|uniref:hypothetical protein n=1 Tax=Litorimonas sp. TaxID=1892381 RepID=UPI003A8470F0
MLHGTQVRFCNTVNATLNPRQVDHGDENTAHALLQLQFVQVEHAPRPAAVFWDNGSNVNLVRAAYASQLGLEGRPVDLQLTTTGGVRRMFSTHEYTIRLVDRKDTIHEVVVMEMEQLAAAQPEVDLSALSEIFPQLDPSRVQRPTGEIDLLLGIHLASLHPTVSACNIVGELRVCNSLFGTGLLLDGCDPRIRIPENKNVRLDHSAYEYSRDQEEEAIATKLARCFDSSTLANKRPPTPATDFLQSESAHNLDPTALTSVKQPISVDGSTKCLDTAARTLSVCGFTVKLTVHPGETRPATIELLK